MHAVREAKWPLVLFTVLAQAAVGLTWVLAWARFLVPSRSAPGSLEPVVAAGFPVVLVLLGLGVLAALFHLGRIGAARFALSNLRSSWLSREVLFAGLFAVAVVLRIVTTQSAWGIVAAVLGLALVVAIAGVYRIRTVPAWNHWTTPLLFVFGALLVGMSAFLVLLLGVGASYDAAGKTLDCSDAFISRAILGMGLGSVVPAAVLLLLTVARLGAFGTRLPGVAVWRILTLVLGAIPMHAYAWRGWTPGHSPIPPLVLAAVLFPVSELLGRHLFYASHERIGL